MIAQALALALAALLSAAEPSKPPPAPPPAPQGAPAGPERVSFAEAMSRAAARAATATIAVEEVRRAEALLVEARSASLPQVFAGASLTLLDGDRVQAAPTLANPNATRVVVPRDERSANVSVQVPLLAPSRWASWAAASEGVAVARASEADVRRTTVLTAARAYLAILAQKRVIDVSRSAIEIAKARFDFAHARRAGGVGNALDELRAEQQLATGEAQLENGVVGLVRAQEALGFAAGADAPLDAAEDPVFSLDVSLEEAEARRPDLRAARERLEGADVVLRYSWTDWLPSLVASAQGFVNDPSTFTSPSSGWQIQFVLTVPIFEGGLRVGQQRERQALEHEAKIQLDATLRVVHSDVRLATETVSRQEAALTSSRLASARARSVLKLTIESYKAGATNDLDVSTAQQQSRDADLQAVIAEDAVRQARLDLLSAVGQFP